LPPNYVVRRDKDEFGGAGNFWEDAFQDFDKRNPNDRVDSSKPQADGAVVHRIVEFPATYADEIVVHLPLSSPVPFTDYSLSSAIRIEPRRITV
jgi:hypothetical protein